MVWKGQVEFRCDSLTRHLEAPCYMVVPMGSVHGFRFAPETAGHVLSLSSGFSARAANPGDPLLRLLTYGANGVLADAELERVKWLCGELLALQADWRTPEPLFLALAEALLRLLSVDSNSEIPESLQEKRLSEFRRLIELHLREHRSVDWYARQLGTTGKTLTRACRQWLDCTPTSLIHSRLALEAQRLLCFTNASVVEAADDLGFSDSSYFSRFYRRMTGKRPMMDRTDGGKRRPRRHF